MLARSWLNENFVNERFFSGVDYEGGLGDLSSRLPRIKFFQTLQSVFQRVIEKTVKRTASFGGGGWQPTCSGNHTRIANR